MYERNAIVLERYFNQMFGYNMKNNIKTNFNDYCELVEALEKYKNISEEEETIIQEYDSIANKIRDIQRTQENLNKRNARMQEERANIFQSVGENSVSIQKKLDNVNSNIESLNGDIKENAQKFVDVVSQFNEKTAIRTSCGKTRRTLEGEYNRKLNETLDHYQDIDIDFERKAKQFIEMGTESIEKEIKEKMKKNGEKEKIPFNTSVLTKAITLCVDIQKREADILTNIYDRTNRLFTEIKNNSIKNDKHKKSIKDAKSKLEFISAIKEYLVQFLDNERLTAVNGEEEHGNLMKEACKNLDEDIVQINNLYTLLIKEGAKKITKKSYSELYNFDYLRNLEIKAEEFDNEVKKLNLPVTIINPNYWRIEGMKKIYDVFYKCVTENYERDLSEYMPIEDEDKIEDDDDEENYYDDFEIQEDEEKTDELAKSQKDDTKTEIDRKIDRILGAENRKKNYHDEEDDDDEDDFGYDEFEDEEDDNDIENDFGDDYFGDDEEDDDYFGEDEEDEIKEKQNGENKDDEDEYEEDDDVSFDIWGNNINKNKKNTKENVKKEDNDDDELEDDFDDDFDWDDEEDDDFTNDDDLINNEDEEDDGFDDDDEEIKNENDFYDENEEDDEENIVEDKKDDMKNRKKTKKNNWEDEFVNINKKDKTKKKKGFFDKFKK